MRRWVDVVLLQGENSRQAVMEQLVGAGSLLPLGGFQESSAGFRLSGKRLYPLSNLVSPGSHYRKCFPLMCSLSPCNNFI